MLDQILNVVKEKAAEALSQQGVEGAAAEQASEATQNSLVDTVKELLAGGNIDSIKEMFSGDGEAGAASEAGQNIMNKLKEKLVNDTDVDNAQAEGVSSGLLKNILGGLGEKFQSSEEGDSAFDLDNITGLLGGEGLVENLKDKLGDTLGGMFGKK